MALHRSPPSRLTLVAAAVLAVPAHAGIVVSGQVSPDPTLTAGVVDGFLTVGATAAGTVTVNGGSLLTMDNLTLGSGFTGNGTVIVSGAASAVTAAMSVIPVSGVLNMNLGSQGIGRLVVEGGATFTAGLAGGPSNCEQNCRVRVANGAGSQGSVEVTGAGSLFTTPGQVRVGSAAALLNQFNIVSYGQPGADGRGSMSVTAGAQAQSSQLSVAIAPDGAALTGAERSIGTVLVDGIGSVWNVVRNATFSGAQAMLSLASGRRTDATVTVSGGGSIVVDGSVAPGEFTGINIASLGSNTDATGAVGALTVTGAGSRVVQQGGVGFTNLARGNGAQGTLRVLDGGFFGSADAAAARGMTSLNIGRGGGNGTLVVEGTGSTVLLSGVNSNNNSFQPTVAGSGAFLNVGQGESGAGGTGTATISNGGRLVIDNANQPNVPSNGQTGFMVGRNGAQGTLTLQGPGSTMEVRSGTGTAAYTAVGRDGSTGQMTVRDGGVLTITSAGTSTPNLGATGYLPGDVGILDVGRRVGAAGGVATQGTLNINGVDAKVVMNGARDSLLVIGRGELASGTVNITQGGAFEGKSVLVGQDGGTGSLVMNQGRMTLTGTLQGGPSAGQGVGLSIGRGGNGTAQLLNGSVVTIDSASGSPSLGLAGSTVAPGGIGTMLVGGGSSVSVNGPGARVEVGRTVDANGIGLGTLALGGAGSSVIVNGVGARVLMGGVAGSDGRVTVGAGSLLQATDFIGVAHDGTASTSGSGRLTANGTVTAAQLTIGTLGVLGGSGTINANVVNFGTINPGESPGRLTINGDYDGRGGRIVLEVASDGGGGFLFDEIVFGSAAQVLLDGATIEFDFLGDADPFAFLDAGLFDLDTFFSTSGGQDLGDEVFGQVRYTASSERYAFSEVTIGPDGAVSFEASAVPLPSSLALALLALAALRGVPRRRTPTISDA